MSWFTTQSRSFIRKNMTRGLFRCTHLCSTNKLTKQNQTGLTRSCRRTIWEMKLNFSSSVTKKSTSFILIWQRRRSPAPGTSSRPKKILSLDTSSLALRLTSVLTYRPSSGKPIACSTGWVIWAACSTLCTSLVRFSLHLFQDTRSTLNSSTPCSVTVKVKKLKVCVCAGQTLSSNRVFIGVSALAPMVLRTRTPWWTTSDTTSNRWCL